MGHFALNVAQRVRQLRQIVDAGLAVLAEEGDDTIGDSAEA